ncbi:MAG TPA: VRR-NUC domain-containing protein [Anaerolineaceae bacterium]|nr:VRR-NUC domain-containing protein [Anaerolineaceae bacterium]
MSEQDLVNSIIDFLRYQGAWAIRVNAGMKPIEGKDGRRRMFRGAPAGTPDVIACWPGGLFMGIECKLAGNKPTDLQQATLDQIRETGGLTVVAYSIDDVENAIRERIQQCQK